MSDYNSTLSNVTCVVFPKYPLTDGSGHIQLRMSKTDPSYPIASGGTLYAPGDANTLVLHEGQYVAGNFYDCPALMTDVNFDDEAQTSTGQASLQNILIGFRDCSSYSGTYNGATLAEDFTIDPFLSANGGHVSTFFTEFFCDTVGSATKDYPVVLWVDLFEGDGTTLKETSYVLHVDPNYKPQNQQLIEQALSSAESLNEGALRTVQATDTIDLLKSTPWQNVLNTIQETDCIQGAGYMGFIVSEPGAVTYQGGGVNSSGVFASSAIGQYAQATPFLHFNGSATVPGTGDITNAVNPVKISDPSPGTSTWVRGAAVIGPWPNLSGSHLPWNPNHIDWWGPNGTWWISLGTLFQKIAGSTALTTPLKNPHGMLTGVDGSITNVGGVSYFNITTNKFSSTFTGKQIVFDYPPTGQATDTVTYVSPTQLKLTSVWTTEAGPLYFFLPGTDEQQLLFDVTGQMGSGSPLALNSYRVFAQKPDTANFCYPVDTTRGRILPKDIYISVNALCGCHPYDGSQWLNPLAINPSDSIDQALQGLCNFIGCYYSTLPDATTKQPTLVLNPYVQTGTLPTNWIPVGEFQESEPSTAANAVVVNNTGSSAGLMCPWSNSTNVANYTIPIQLRGWGLATTFTQDMSFLWAFSPTPSGTSIDQLFQSNGLTAGGLVVDGTIDINDTPDKCFQVAWGDSNGNPVLNPDCWRSLAFAMFRDDSGANIMYPSTGGLATPLNGIIQGGGYATNWPGQTGLTSAFYALGVQYGPSETPNVNEPNTGRMNSLAYQATAMGTLLVQGDPTLRQIDFKGVLADDGTLSGVKLGSVSTTWYDGKSRNFRAVAIPRQILGCLTTGVKFQNSGANAFPDLGSALVGPANSQVSSGSSGGATAGGSSSFFFGGLDQGELSYTLTANTDNLILPFQAAETLVLLKGNFTLTGIVPSITVCRKIVIFNAGTGTVTLKNQTGSSAASQFFIPGGDIIIRPGLAFSFWYSPSISKWIYAP